MAKVRVRLLSFYKDLFGGKEFIEMEIREPIALDKVLEKLAEIQPKIRKYKGTPLLNTMLNGHTAGPDAIVKPGDEIAIMPIPSGG